MVSGSSALVFWAMIEIWTLWAQEVFSVTRHYVTVFVPMSYTGYSTPQAPLQQSGGGLQVDFESVFGAKATGSNSLNSDGEHFHLIIVKHQTLWRVRRSNEALSVPALVVYSRIGQPTKVTHSRVCNGAAGLSCWACFTVGLFCFTFYRQLLWLKINLVLGLDRLLFWVTEMLNCADVELSLTWNLPLRLAQNIIKQITQLEKGAKQRTRVLCSRLHRKGWS